MKKEKIIAISIWCSVLLWAMCLFLGLLVHFYDVTGALSEIARYRPCLWRVFLVAIFLYWPVTTINAVLLIIEILSVLKPYAPIRIFEKFLKWHIVVLAIIFFVLLMCYSFDFHELFYDLFSLCFTYQYLFSSW